MSIRKLFALLVALAVLFAPAVTRAGEAFAAVPDHHMQMMESGHCKAPPSDQHEQQQDDDATGKSCCMSICAGAAITPGVPLSDRASPRVPAAFLVPTYHLGYLGELATPPPRRA